MPAKVNAVSPARSVEEPGRDSDLLPEDWSRDWGAGYEVALAGRAIELRPDEKPCSRDLMNTDIPALPHVAVPSGAGQSRRPSCGWCA